MLLACLLISGDAAHLLAANMRSFIESVLRNAPVAYVGSVKEVRLLRPPSRRSSLSIHSTPAFRLDIFCTARAGKLLQRVKVLRDALAKMSPDQLKVNEITEDDRRVQMSLYDKLSAYLRAAR